MTCRKIRQGLMSDPLLEEDFDHLQNCEACMEAVISMQLKSNADAAFAGRRAYSTQLLVWKGELRKRRVQQEQVAFVSQLGVQLLCLGGLGATVATIGFSFSLGALAMYTATHGVLPELFGAALIAIILCVSALQAVFREMKEYRTFCAQGGLDLKHGSSPTV